MSRVLCIYPQDSTTRFLDRIQNHLKQTLAQTFHCYKVKPNQNSHEQCLERLRTNAEEEFVIFLGHGRSDRLYGANTNSDFFISPYFEYENDSFINTSNIDVFRGKKVFCLSCNSAEGLGKLAFQMGAKAFIGFGDIPTDDEIIVEINRKLPVFIARFKGELTWIVKTSLAHAITHRRTIFELVDIIRLLTNVRMNDIILRNRSLRQRRLLADYLFDFKQNLKVFGDGSELVLS